MLRLADSHIHLFRNGFAGRYGRRRLGGGSEVDAYEAYRRVHNIAASLVVGYEDDDIDPSNNEYLRTLAESRPWMATLANLRPFGQYTSSQIEKLFDAGHCGLSFYLPDPDAAESVVQFSASFWQVLEDRRAIVSLNVTRDALYAVRHIAGDHEACSFAISHLGNPGRHRVVPLRTQASEELAPLLSLAELPNVYVKISGLYAISDPCYGYPHLQATPFVELILGAFAPRRCMWGSDFPPSLDHVSFEQTVNAPQLLGLTEGEYAEVMCGTLMRLLVERR